MKLLPILLSLLTASLYAGGTLTQLSDGITHFEVKGPETAPVVVLIHGVSGPMTVWDKTSEALAGAGFRVVRLDLYGRGKSGRVKNGHYDLDMYVRQVTDLLEKLGIKEFNLVGSSMGDIISSEIALRYPDRVKKMALVGPAGFPLDNSPQSKLLKVPFLGKFIMDHWGLKQLSEHDKDYFFHPEKFKDFEDAYDAQLLVPGSLDAIRLTYKNVPLQEYLPGYAKLGEQKRKILLIWGKEDHAFPYDNHVKAMEALRNVEFVPVPEAGHLPQYERDDIVSPALIKFLKP